MELEQTNPELLEALKRETGFESFDLHTGGGVMVAVVDLSIDARGLGMQAWLTREGADWLLGFYNFADSEEDEGVCVTLFTPGEKVDNAEWIATQVAGIFKRLHITPELLFSNA